MVKRNVVLVLDVCEYGIWYAFANDGFFNVWTFATRGFIREKGLTIPVSELMALGPGRHQISRESNLPIKLARFKRRE